MRQHRLFWASSYDRGLQHLLKMWPEVVKKFPKAELHVYYGWNLFESVFRTNPERMNWMERMNEAMKHKGIVHHGRVGQPELKKAREHCGIWAYPTDFDEINCITALECQRDGCVPCVVDRAALKETVGAGVRVEGDIFDPEVKDEYLKQLLNLMSDEGLWKEQQTLGREFAKAFSWPLIAKQWHEVFKA